MTRLRSSKKHICQEPETELDFHTLRPGVSPKEIERAVEDYIKDLREQRVMTVRFIVGRGSNSHYGPVVAPTVKNTLLRMAKEKKIKYFEQETLPSGIKNEGAIIVYII